MTTNNFKGWYDEVLVTYLNYEQGEAVVHIKEPVEVWVNQTVLVSLVEVLRVFSPKGVEALRSVFSWSGGNREEGLSKGSLRTDKHFAVLRYCEKNNLTQHLRDDELSFLVNTGLNRDRFIWSKILKRKWFDGIRPGSAEVHRELDKFYKTISVEEREALLDEVSDFTI